MHPQVVDGVPTRRHGPSLPGLGRDPHPVLATARWAASAPGPVHGRPQCLFLSVFARKDQGEGAFFHFLVCFVEVRGPNLVPRPSLRTPAPPGLPSPRHSQQGPGICWTPQALDSTLPGSPCPSPDLTRHWRSRGGRRCLRTSSRAQESPKQGEDPACAL